jgi:hypothetical protein
VIIQAVKVALFFAIIIPFGFAVRHLHDWLGQSSQDVWTGIVIGFVLCFALWRWHERITEQKARAFETERHPE